MVSKFPPNFSVHLQFLFEVLFQLCCMIIILFQDFQRLHSNVLSGWYAISVAVMIIRWSCYVGCRMEIIEMMSYHPCSLDIDILKNCDFLSWSWGYLAFFLSYHTYSYSKRCSRHGIFPSLNIGPTYHLGCQINSHCSILDFHRLLFNINMLKKLLSKKYLWVNTTELKIFRGPKFGIHFFLQLQTLPHSGSILSISTLRRKTCGMGLMPTLCLMVTELPVRERNRDIVVYMPSTLWPLV